MMEKDKQLFTPDQVDEQIEHYTSKHQRTPEAHLIQDLREVAQQMRAEHTGSLQRTWGRLQEQSKLHSGRCEGQVAEKRARGQRFKTRDSLSGQSSSPRKPRHLWRSLGIAAAIAFLLVNLLAWSWLIRAIQHPGTQVGGPVKATPTGAPHGETSPPPNVSGSSRPFCSFQDKNPDVPSNYNIEHSLSWSPDGKLTTTAWNVSTFNVNTCQQVASPTSNQEVNAYWSPNGTRLLVTWANAQILDRQGHVVATHIAPSTGLTFNGVGTTGPNPMIQLSGGGNALEDSAWSPDGKYAASVYTSHLSYGVETWNATTGAHQFFLLCPNDSAYGIRDVSWSPNGKYIAAVAPNGHGVCVWRASDGSTVSDIPGGASQAAFSADSKQLAYNQRDTVEIYDLAARSIVRSFPVQYAKEGIYSLAWSPNGKYLAVAGHDVYLLDASTGALLATCHTAHGTWIEHLAWSPNSTMLAGEAYILDNPIAFVSAWRVVE